MPPPTHMHAGTHPSTHHKHMVSELDTERCVRTMDLQGRWIVRSHIGWKRKRIISHKNVETTDVFYNREADDDT